MDGGPLKLRIVTPQRLVLEETAAMVTAEGALGQFGVLPQHIAFLTALEPGILTVKAAGSERRIAIKGGFAEVRDDVVTILADEAVAAGEIDAAGAAAAIANAERALEEAPYGHSEHDERVRERRWADVLAALAAVH
jgi:F-type H+-transporting ATPase subunit epsilon